MLHKKAKKLKNFVKNSEGKQILLPAISDVIKNIDLEQKKIVVNLIEGLL